MQDYNEAVKQDAEAFIKQYNSMFKKHGKNWQASTTLCDMLTTEIEFMKDFNDSNVTKWVLENTGGFHDFGDIEEDTQKALIAYEDDVASEISNIMDEKNIYV